MQFSSSSKHFFNWFSAHQFRLVLLFLFGITITPSVVAAFSGGQWAMLATQYGSDGGGGDGWTAADRHHHHHHHNAEQQQHQPRHQPQQKCLDIPANFTLCHGMQYKTMRLPNLLEHDTLDEAIQQGSAWVSLLRLHCHPHTKLFLCSLFAPVCLPQLEKPIQPCRSLCAAVQQGCAARMAKYGFPWPEMLNCTQFAVDNDLCIKPPPAQENTSAEKHSRPICKSCAQVATFENLMDNFCRSSTVLKVRLRPLNQSHMVVVRKQRVFKSATTTTTAAGASTTHLSHSHSGNARWKRKFRRELSTDDNKHDADEKEAILVRLAENGEGRCQCPFANSVAGDARHVEGCRGTGTFLVMASEKRRGAAANAAANGKYQQQLNAKLVIPWRQEKVFKAAIRKFKRVNCNTLGREIRESVLSQMFKRQAV